MRLLLDTHVFLFATNEPERLSGKVTSLLLDDQVERWVSSISLWEIATKIKIGKMRGPTDRGYYLQKLLNLRARILPVSAEHSLAGFELPMRHRDPFDRLLVAQALEENLILVTNDQAISGYPIATLW